MDEVRRQMTEARLANLKEIEVQLASLRKRIAILQQLTGRGGGDKIQLHREIQQLKTEIEELDKRAHES